jgi:hypothetical protein
MADPKQATNGDGFDPMAAFRDVRDTYLDAWAKAMVEAVNSQAYVKASGTMLDTYLSASAPFRDATEKAMLQTLQQLSMPSRADFIGVAERLTNVEMRLDDMDAKLDRIEKLLTKPVATGSGGKPEPERRPRKRGAR